MRHNIVEGEPGSLPWPQWQLWRLLRRAFGGPKTVPPPPQPDPEPEKKAEGD
jgi:hypothetical protein